MMFMTMRHDSSGRQAIAQGRPIEIRFHVMRGQRVSAEQHVHESFVDEPCQGITPSRMDDRRPSSHQHLASVLPGPMPLAQLLHAFRHVSDDVAVGPLRRHLRLHEAEDVTLLGPPQRSHSNSASSNHHGITARDAGHRHCVRTGSLLIHDDAEIHLHPFDIDPLTREPDLGG